MADIAVIFFRFDAAMLLIYYAAVFELMLLLVYAAPRHLLTFTPLRCIIYYYYS